LLHQLKSHPLDKTYKNERDARVRERILLVIRISSDKQRIDSVARELHRSRSWAYKWYKRYNDEGLEEGMKDKPRSGKPPITSKETMDEIKQELSGSSTGWDFRQVMDLIQKKTGIRYHKVHVYRLLHRWGFSSKVPQKRFVRTASQKEKKGFKKG
jgi:putative transposase